MRLTAILIIAFAAATFAQQSCQTRNDCSGDQVCGCKLTFPFHPRHLLLSLALTSTSPRSCLRMQLTLSDPVCGEGSAGLSMTCVEPTDAICAGHDQFCVNGGQCDVCGNPGDFSQLTPCS